MPGTRSIASHFRNLEVLDRDGGGGGVLLESRAACRLSLQTSGSHGEKEGVTFLLLPLLRLVRVEPPTLHAAAGATRLLPPRRRLFAALLCAARCPGPIYHVPNMYIHIYIDMYIYTHTYAHTHTHTHTHTCLPVEDMALHELEV